MPDSFPTRLGQVVLIEETGEEPLTGVVFHSSDHAVVLDLTSPPRTIDHADVSASVFAPEALYRAWATANTTTGRRLVLSDVRDVEVIQRRRWPRRSLTMPISLVAVDAAVPAGVVGETVDIGIGGARVHTVEPVPAGADPLVTLTLPDGEPLLLAARVVWADAAEDGWHYRLAFCDLEDDDAARLAELVGAVPA